MYVPEVREVVETRKEFHIPTPVNNRDLLDAITYAGAKWKEDDNASYLFDDSLKIDVGDDEIIISYVFRN